jgi:hypothetical protein
MPSRTLAAKSATSEIADRMLKLPGCLPRDGVLALAWDSSVRRSTSLARTVRASVRAVNALVRRGWVELRTDSIVRAA